VRSRVVSSDDEGVDNRVERIKPRRKIVTTDDESEDSSEDSDEDTGTVGIDHQLKLCLTFDHKGGCVRRGLYQPKPGRLDNRGRYYSTVKVDVAKFRRLVLDKVHPKVIITLIFCTACINTLNADFASRSRIHCCQNGESYRYHQ
jgi:hypothetical protein